MSTRPTLVLLSLLVVLGVIAFVVQGPCSVDRPREHAAVFPALEAGEVQLIRATTGAGLTVLLSRTDGMWRLGEAGDPAANAAVNALLADVVSARELAVVSTNVAKQAAFETAAGSGISVRLEAAGGKLIAAFVVGTRGPDFASCHLRREGATEVLLVTPDLRTAFSRPPGAWREPPKQADAPAPPGRP